MANETSTAYDVLAREAPAGDFHPDVAAVVDRLLADFVTARSTRLAATHPALALLADAARDAVLSPGKRLRPTFAYWGWRGAAGRAGAPEPIVPALAALEMLHTFALVHDDVMDDSPLRRGRPTAHRALAHAHSASALRGDAARFGLSGAILVGDLCLVWADELIGLAQLPADRL
jgi:geranylgeranyl diphosphate synthase type I